MHTLTFLTALAVVPFVAAQGSSPLASFIAACGDPCSKAGLPHSNEAGLTAKILSLDPDSQNPVISWSSTSTTSLLDKEDNYIRGTIYGVYANDTFPLGSLNLTSLFSDSYLSPADESTRGGGGGVIPLTTAWPASVRSVVLDAEFEAILDIFPTCPDVMSIGLQVFSKSTGAAVGSPFYTPVFAWCYSALNWPWFTIDYPSPTNTDNGAVYIAGAGSYTVNFTVLGNPHTYLYDVSFIGTDFQYEMVGPNETHKVVGIPSSSPFGPAHLVGYNSYGDGTGMQYSVTFTAPASAAGCWLQPLVTATVTSETDPTGELAAAWYVDLGWESAWNNWWGDLPSYFSDPLTLTTSIAPTAPLYGAVFTLGGGFTVAWSGTGLLATDVLTLSLTETQSGETYEWLLEGINPINTSTANVTLAAYDSKLAPLGYTYSSNASKPLLPSINYQASLTVYRTTFSFQGSTSFFSVLPANPPTITATVVGSNGVGAPTALGQNITLNWAVGGGALPPGISTLSVDLYISTKGRHDPNGDLMAAKLSSTILLVGQGGAVTLTLPSDASASSLATSSYYFLGVYANGASYIAASSPYFSVAPPTLGFNSPTATTMGSCGSPLTLGWTAWGVSAPLHLDLYVYDDAAGRDVLAAPLTTGVSATSQSALAITLPSTAVKGRYAVYGYTGATFKDTVLAVKSPYFVVSCASSLVVPPLNFTNYTAGDSITIPYTAINLPLGHIITIDLRNPVSKAILLVVSPNETFKSYFTWSTPPTLYFTNAVLRLSDASNPSVYAETSAFSALQSPLFMKVSAGGSTGFVKAGKAMPIIWTSTGIPATDDCTVDIYSMISEFQGPTFVDTLGVIPCGKGLASYTFDDTLSSVPYYMVFVTRKGDGFGARSDLLVLNGGATAQGWAAPSASTSEGGGGRRRLTPSSAGSLLDKLCAQDGTGIWSPLFGGAQLWGTSTLPAATYMQVLCQPSCDLCLQMGGNWLVGASLTFSPAIVGPSPVPSDSLPQLAAFLGATSISGESFCWPGPGTASMTSNALAYDANNYPVSLPLGSMSLINKIVYSAPLASPQFPAYPAPTQASSVAPGVLSTLVVPGDVPTPYTIYIPSSYSPGVTPSMGIVFFFVGPSDVYCNGGVSGICTSDQFTSLSALAETKKFILVYPTPLSTPKPDAPGQTMALFTLVQTRKIFSDVATRAVFNPSKVFASGWGGVGGSFAYTLGCQASDIFSAVAPFHGSLGLGQESASMYHPTTQGGPPNYTPKGYIKCPASPPPRLFSVAAEGTFLGQNYIEGNEEAGIFAQKMGCSPLVLAEPGKSWGPQTGTASSYSTTGVTCAAASGCPTGFSVTHCKATSGGGSFTLDGGNTFDYGANMYDFFFNQDPTPQSAYVASSVDAQGINLGTQYMGYLVLNSGVVSGLPPGISTCAATAASNIPLQPYGTTSAALRRELAAGDTRNLCNSAVQGISALLGSAITSNMITCTANPASTAPASAATPYNPSSCKAQGNPSDSTSCSCGWNTANPTLYPFSWADEATGTVSPASRNRIFVSVPGYTPQRSYLLILPPNIASLATADLPVFLMYGGNPQTALEFAEYTGFDQITAQKDAIVVFMEGVVTTGNSGNGVGASWNAGACCGDAVVDDIAYTLAVLSDLSDRVCYNPKKLFAAGWSAGGYMSYYLACKLPGLFAVIGPVGGLVGIDPTVTEKCPASLSTRVLSFMDVGDPSVAYTGLATPASGTNPARGAEIMGAEALVSLFAAKQGCSGGNIVSTGTVSYSKGIVTCYSATGCPATANATLCKVNDMVHAWPSAAAADPRNVDKVLGFSYVGTLDIDGNMAMYNAFMAPFLAGGGGGTSSRRALNAVGDAAAAVGVQFPHHSYHARALGATVHGTHQREKAVEAALAALDFALTEGQLGNAIAIAKALRPARREEEVAGGSPPSALETWMTFIAPSVTQVVFRPGGPPKDAHGAGLGLPTAPPEGPMGTHRLITLPSGTTVPLKALGNEFTGGLPGSGFDLPVAGFLYKGVFYADEGAHECTPSAPGSAIQACRLAGGEVTHFPSEAEAEEAVQAARALGVAAYLGSHSLGGGAGDVRRRVLQWGSLTTTPLPALKMDTANLFPANVGARTIAIVRAMWSDQSGGEGPWEIPTPAYQANMVSGVTKEWNPRALGATTLTATAPPCLYRLGAAFTKASVKDYGGIGGSTNWLALVVEATKAAMVAASGTVDVNGVTCPTYTLPELDAFHHFVVLHPSTAGSWAGLAECPGQRIALKGGNQPVAAIQHELGHNFGLQHSATVPTFYQVRVEYGDNTDVMGSGSRTYVTDHSAGYKHGIGWLPDAAVVTLDALPKPWVDYTSRPATTASATFLLGAVDRDYPSGVGGPAALPSGVYLTARAPVPPRWYFQGLTNTPVFAYLTYRSQTAGGKAPGVYINEVPMTATSVGPSVLFCYRDASCHDQPPIAAFDAVVYDPSGMALLVEVGGPQKSGFPQTTLNTPAADAALPIRVAYLNWDGMPLDGSPPSATSRVLPMDAASNLFTLKTCGGGATPFTLAAKNPVAVFLFQPPTPTVITATPTCSEGYTGLATSVFIGPFPTAHAYYGGNIGVGGDTNALGCKPVTFSAGPASPVWVVIGSPGKARGSFAKGSLAYTCGTSFKPSWDASIMVSTYGYNAEDFSANYIARGWIPSVVDGGLWDRLPGGCQDMPTTYECITAVTNTNENGQDANSPPCTGPTKTLTYEFCDANFPVWHKTSVPYTSYTQMVALGLPPDDLYNGDFYLFVPKGWNKWAIMHSSNAFPGASGAGFAGADTEGTTFQYPGGGSAQYVFKPTSASLTPSLATDPATTLPSFGMCPAGSYLSVYKGGCLPCPKVGQTTDPYQSASDGTRNCRCPRGWALDASSTTCVGAHIGGPLAVKPTTSSAQYPVVNSKGGGGAIIDALGNAALAYPYGSTCLGTSFVLGDYTVVQNCVPLPRYPLVEAVDVLNNPVIYQLDVLGNYQPRDPTQRVLPNPNTGSPTLYYWSWNATVDASNPASPIYSWSLYGTLTDTSGQYVPFVSLSTPRPQLAPNPDFPSWTAFCANGATTLGAGGVRECYCGPGAYANTAGLCALCPAGMFRGVGGALSSADGACSPCPSGKASPTGAEACTPSPCDPTKYTTQGSVCTPLAPVAALPSIALNVGCGAAGDVSVCQSALNNLFSGSSGGVEGSRVRELVGGKEEGWYAGSPPPSSSSLARVLEVRDLGNGGTIRLAVKKPTTTEGRASGGGKVLTVFSKTPNAVTGVPKMALGLKRKSKGTKGNTVALKAAFRAAAPTPAVVVVVSTLSSTSTVSITPTRTPTKAAPVSLTSTPTPSRSPTPTGTASKTITRTPTTTRSVGASLSNTPSNTRTPSGTPSRTPSNSGTPSGTRTGTGTPTRSLSWGASPSNTPSPTPTPSPTRTTSGTRSGTRTRSGTPTSSLTKGSSPSTTSTTSLYPSDTMTNLPSATNSPAASSTSTKGLGTRKPTTTMTPLGTSGGGGALALSVVVAVPAAAAGTAAGALAPMLSLIGVWMGVPAGTPGVFTPLARGGGYTFTLYVPTTWAAGAGGGGGGGSSLRRAQNGNLSTSAVSSAATAAAIASLSSFIDAKSNDGSLPLALAQSGLATSLGYDSVDSLINALAVQPVVVAVAGSKGGETTNASGATGFSASSNGSSNNAAIIGGVVGGVVGAALFGLGAWALYCRRAQAKYASDDGGGLSSVAPPKLTLRG